MKKINSIKKLSYLAVIHTRENSLMEFIIFFLLLTKLKPHIYSDQMIGVVKTLIGMVEQCDKNG